MSVSFKPSNCDEKEVDDDDDDSVTILENERKFRY